MEKLNYGGEIADFPQEIVLKMLERQVEQGNPRNVSVFERQKDISSHAGGFKWEYSEEGHPWWGDVINNKNFNLFFDKYPRTKPPAQKELKTRREKVKYLQAIIEKTLKNGLGYYSEQPFDKVMVTSHSNKVIFSWEFNEVGILENHRYSDGITLKIRANKEANIIYDAIGKYCGAKIRVGERGRLVFNGFDIGEEYVGTSLFMKPPTKKEINLAIKSIDLLANGGTTEGRGRIHPSITIDNTRVYLNGLLFCTRDDGGRILVTKEHFMNKYAIRIIKEFLSLEKLELIAGQVYMDDVLIDFGRGLRDRLIYKNVVGTLFFKGWETTQTDYHLKQLKKDNKYIVVDTKKREILLNLSDVENKQIEKIL